MTGYNGIEKYIFTGNKKFMIFNIKSQVKCAEYMIILDDFPNEFCILARNLLTLYLFFLLLNIDAFNFLLQ